MASLNRLCSALRALNGALHHGTPVDPVAHSGLRPVRTSSYEFQFFPSSVSSSSLFFRFQVRGFSTVITVHGWQTVTESALRGLFARVSGEFCMIAAAALVRVVLSFPFVLLFSPFESVLSAE
jgi:hypothetical protein